MHTLVQDLMKTDVIKIQPTASLKEGLQLMDKHKVKSLIVNKGRSSDAYGILEYLNVAKEIIANEGDIELLNVYDVASKPVIQVSKELEAKYVVRLMLEHNISRVLVVDNNELEGFISLSDVMASVIKETVEDS